MASFSHVELVRCSSRVGVLFLCWGGKVYIDKQVTVKGSDALLENKNPSGIPGSLHPSLWLSTLEDEALVRLLGLCEPLGTCVLLTSGAVTILVGRHDWQVCVYIFLSPVAMYNQNA